MQIIFLTSKNSWVNEKKKFILQKKVFKGARIITKPTQINSGNDILVMLSYTKLLSSKYLNRSKFNLVVHESDLPKGKGWTPLFWQILEGKTKITTTLFNANSKVDDGKIIKKKNFHYEKNLVYGEIKEKQLKNALSLVENFVKKFLINKKIKFLKLNKKSKSSYYKRRTPVMSKINLNQSLKSQFNLLRISDNKSYPCYFNYNGSKYYLKLIKKKKS